MKFPPQLNNFSDISFFAFQIRGIFDERLVIGGDFAGNLLGGGVRGELIVSAERENLNSNFTTLIFGADYQVSLISEAKECGSLMNIVMPARQKSMPKEYLP